MLLSVLTLTFGLGLGKTYLYEAAGSGKTYLIETAGSGYSKHLRRADLEPEKYHGERGSDNAEEVLAHHDTDLASDEDLAHEEEVLADHDAQLDSYEELAYEEEVSADHDAYEESIYVEEVLADHDSELEADEGSADVKETRPAHNATSKELIEECLDKNNVAHKIGDSYTGPDECLCFCTARGSACTRVGCVSPLKGYSCVDDNGIHRYQEGETYTSVNGCQKETCTCKYGKLDCKRNSEDCPKLVKE